MRTASTQAAGSSSSSKDKDKDKDKDKPVDTSLWRRCFYDLPPWPDPEQKYPIDPFTQLPIIGIHPAYQRLLPALHECVIFYLASFRRKPQASALSQLLHKRFLVVTDDTMYSCTRFGYVTRCMPLCAWVGVLTCYAQKAVGFLCSTDIDFYCEVADPENLVRVVTSLYRKIMDRPLRVFRCREGEQMTHKLQLQKPPDWVKKMLEPRKIHSYEADLVKEFRMTMADLPRLKPHDPDLLIDHKINFEPPPTIEVLEEHIEDLNRRIASLTEASPPMSSCHSSPTRAGLDKKPSVLKTHGRSYSDLPSPKATRSRSCPRVSFVPPCSSMNRIVSQDCVDYQARSGASWRVSPRAALSPKESSRRRYRHFANGDDREVSDRDSDRDSDHSEGMVTKWEESDLLRVPGDVVTWPELRTEPQRLLTPPESRSDSVCGPREGFGEGMGNRQGSELFSGLSIEIPAMEVVLSTGSSPVSPRSPGFNVPRRSPQRPDIDFAAATSSEQTPPGSPPGSPGTEAGSARGPGRQRCESGAAASGSSGPGKRGRAADSERPGGAERRGSGPHTGQAPEPQASDGISSQELHIDVPELDAGAVCPGCRAPVGDGPAVVAQGARWHADCFRCRRCQLPLDPVLYLCYDGGCYHKACLAAVLTSETETGTAPATDPRCEKCGEPVRGKCYRIRGGVYHVPCLSCSACGRPITSAFCRHETHLYHPQCLPDGAPASAAASHQPLDASPRPNLRLDPGPDLKPQPDPASSPNPGFVLQPLPGANPTTSPQPQCDTSPGLWPRPMGRDPYQAPYLSRPGPGSPLTALPGHAYSLLGTPPPFGTRGPHPYPPLPYPSLSPLLGSSPYASSSLYASPYAAVSPAQFDRILDGINCRGLGTSAHPTANPNPVAYPGPHHHNPLLDPRLLPPDGGPFGPHVEVGYRGSDYMPPLAPGKSPQLSGQSHLNESPAGHPSRDQALGFPGNPADQRACPAMHGKQDASVGQDAKALPGE